MDKKVSLLIPAYNEEDSLGDAVKAAKEIECIDEIIVIDDCSVDNTLNVAKECGVKVIHHPYNKGYGASLKSGIRQATGGYIVTMDADGQHNPKFIPDMVKWLDEFEMVVGQRGPDSHCSLLRLPGRAILGLIASYLAGFKIPDLNSGFRCFRRDVALEYLHLLPNTFSFSTTITMALFKAGYSVKYVPIVAEKRKGGKSRVRQARHGLQTILLMLRVIMLSSPLKIFAPVAGIIFLAGLVYTVVCFIYFRFHIPAGALLMLLSGVMMFLFGIVADQIAALRIERK
ncbi:MAG: glycosyltransferase family 2 protein [Elusimicrobia bacterium]|nr:glycosyltransferase family 2 protein [Elusimicrobiota bacterium]